MLIAVLSFIALALLALAVLTKMILVIGQMQSDCPETGATVRLVAVTVATGFCAIGTGGVLLIAAALPVLADVPVVSLLAALGLASLCLGLGFTHAVNTLRLMLIRSADASAKVETARQEPVVPA
ncbi:MAG: hypothetical protein AAFW87_12825 [Pseudomonadota bacterium]